ncbi:hypothetical protein BT69DRAFT_1289129 [Atractiella rhizophila]|nr:hypothetical protein BT69DRAFT_1289129 [Atractiella rhizophila]
MMLLLHLFIAIIAVASALPTSDETNVLVARNDGVWHGRGIVRGTHYDKPTPQPTVHPHTSSTAGRPSPTGRRHVHEEGTSIERRSIPEPAGVDLGNGLNGDAVGVLDSVGTKIYGHSYTALLNDFLDRLSGGQANSAESHHETPNVQHRDASSTVVSRLQKRATAILKIVHAKASSLSPHYQPKRAVCDNCGAHSTGEDDESLAEDKEVEDGLSGDGVDQHDHKGNSEWMGAQRSW